MNALRLMLVAIMLAPQLATAGKPAPTPAKKKASALSAWQKRKAALLPQWLHLGAEYRVRSLMINPLELNGEQVRKVQWTEQRLQLDLALKVPKIIAIHVQLDILDGALFGDNGQIGSPVPSRTGIGLASKWPNTTRYAIGLAAAGLDPLSRTSYMPMLQTLSPIQVNWAFAEVNLPIGMLRIGRQPYTLGAGMASHDGLRRNRWGVSLFHDTADRLLFATKIDEIVKTFTRGPGYKPDGSRDNGLFLVAAYDWTVQDRITSVSDDLSQFMMGFIWRKRHAKWFDLEWRKLVALAMVVYKTDETFATDVLAFPFRLGGQVGPVHFDLEYTLVTGSTREISAGYAAIKGEQAVDQRLLAMAAHASIAVHVGPFELMAQFNYASGDDDPRPSTPWLGFSYARDFNMGLLMFEHILAFESARSAAVGIETLRSADASAYPVTEVASDGRFFNAIAFFPQVTWHVLNRPDHKLHLRFGALFAWPAAKGGLVDPVMTMRAFDGTEIADDAVNFHGGKPGSYYGTELDLQVSWTWAGVFAWTVEGAVLFPGSSLKDRHGHAVTSFFIENRFEFMF